MTVHALADARSFTSQIPFPCTRLHRRRIALIARAGISAAQGASTRARTHSVKHTHSLGRRVVDVIDSSLSSIIIVLSE